MWTRKELKDQCKIVMRRSYGKMLIAAVLGSLVYGVVNLDVDMITSDMYIAAMLGASLLLLGVFAANPIAVGSARFFVLNRDGDTSISEVFSMFKLDYWNVVKIMLMKEIKIFLWTLCLIVPGIIKAYEYSMIPYILAEDPSTPMDEAFAKSKKMTTNQKMDMFILDFSFIGWYLLGALVCGFGALFVGPYVMGTEAELYSVLKDANRDDLPDLPL